MEQILELVLGNFTATFLIIGAVAVGISVARKGERHLWEAAIAHYCLWVIGVTFLYNFVAHVFFGEMSAAFIGWANSPFQAEVGWASLGFAVVGFLAFSGGFELRLAAVVGPSIFLLGAAGGHVYQMVAADNLAPGNAGVIFWTDIIVPALGAFLLWMRYRRDREGRIVST